MATNKTNGKFVSDSTQRRRKYVINPTFQWKYTALVVMGVFVITTFMSSALYSVLHEQARSSILGHTNPREITVWQNTPVVLLAAMAFAALLALVFGIWTIMFTHRLSGPIFVMENLLREVAEGRIPKRRALRKKDEFKDLYDAIWRVIDVMQSEKRTELAKLTETLNIAQTGATTDSSKTLKTISAQIEAMCKETAGALGEEFTGNSANSDAPASKSEAICAGK